MYFHLVIFCFVGLNLNPPINMAHRKIHYFSWILFFVLFNICMVCKYDPVYRVFPPAEVWYPTYRTYVVSMTPCSRANATCRDICCSGLDRYQHWPCPCRGDRLKPLLWKDDLKGCWIERFYDDIYIYIYWGLPKPSKSKIITYSCLWREPFWHSRWRTQSML